MLLHLRISFWRWAMRQVIGFHWRGQKARDMTVTNETMPVEGGSIRLRIYRPQGQGQGPFPVVLFFHGGGWVGGDLETHDAVCRNLCSRSQHLVIAVDYRLSPEHPFPLPVHDCLASLRWTKDNAARLVGDAQRIVICGDSAGGNLAAVVVQQARSLHPGLVKGQILIYPVMDDCRHAQWPSYKTCGGDGYGLTHKSMSELWDLYTIGSPLWPAGTKHHDLATPLLIDDLKGLPRTLVVLAEEDMLKDEGADYARRLKDAGIEAQVQRYPGQQHGFIGLKPSDSYYQAIEDMARWLRAPRT